MDKDWAYLNFWGKEKSGKSFGGQGPGARGHINACRNPPELRISEGLPVGCSVGFRRVFVRRTPKDPQYRSVTY